MKKPFLTQNCTCTSLNVGSNVLKKNKHFTEEMILVILSSVRNWQQTQGNNANEPIWQIERERVNSKLESYVKTFRQKNAFALF